MPRWSSLLTEGQGEHDHRFSLPNALSASPERLDGLSQEDLGFPGLAHQALHRGALHQQLGPARCVRGCKAQGRQVVGLGHGRVQVPGPVSGQLQGSHRPDLELAVPCALPRGPQELERLAVVVGEDLRVVGGGILSSDGLDPPGGGPVLSAPGGPGDLPVGHIPTRACQKAYSAWWATEEVRWGQMSSRAPARAGPE